MYKFGDIKLYLFTMHVPSTIIHFIQCQFLIYRNNRHFYEFHCNVNKTFTFWALEGTCAIIWDFFKFIEMPQYFMVLFQYVLSDLTRFVHQENIGVDTRIVIICLLELDILARLNFQLKYINTHFYTITT